jgi:serine/threonine-protein kinase RsbW
MKVAATEACNNAVLHTNQQDAMNMIDIVFEIEETCLSIRVKDNGPSFDYEETIAAVTPFRDLEISELQADGLGLFLMQALMDEVTVHSEHGTEVILTKYI